jgi:hypothetical protein
MDMILVRLTSDEIDRVGGIWAGMSGSPVYAADGRLIGAVSYGLAYGASPVAGVTPAADMQELLTRAPDTFSPSAMSAKIPLSDNLQQKLVASGAATTAEADSGLERLPMPMAISGMFNSARLTKVAQKLKLDDVKLYRSGSAPTASGDASAIFAGSNLAASLAYGDFSAVGTGTTTMVCDGKVVGFGHPFNFAGDTSLTLHGANALYVQEDPLGAPFKVSNATGPVGVIDQDRMAGIKGELGDAPQTAVVTTHVTAGTRSRTGTTYVSVPDFEADASAFGLLSNQDRVFDHVGAGSALVHFTISGTTSDGEPFTIVRTNRYANTFDVSFDTIFELGNAVFTLLQNDVTGVDIDSVDVSTTMSTQPRMFHVSQVQLKRAGVWRTLTSTSRIRAKAGRLLNFRVVLGSRRNAYGTKVVTTSIRVPADSLPGTFGQLDLGQAFSDCPDCGDDGTGTSFATFQDIVDSIQNAPRNDELATTLQLFGADGGVGFRGCRCVIPGGTGSTTTVKKLVGDVLTDGRSYEVKVVS